MEYGKPSDNRANYSNSYDVRIWRPTQKPYGSRRRGYKQDSVNVAPTERVPVIVVMTPVIGGGLVAINAEKPLAIELIQM
jgi:hypothetical protein